MKRIIAIALMTSLVFGCLSVASAADYRLIYDESDPHRIIGYAGKLPAELIIPEGVTSIAAKAFRRNHEVEILALPDTLKSVGSPNSSYLDGAFAECSSLREIDTGDGLEYIGPGTFCACPNLTRVTLGNSVETLDERCFWSDPRLGDIAIPDSVTKLGEQAFCVSGLTRVAIGDGLTSTGYHTFQDCSSLRTISLGNNVRTIGEGSFWGAGLESVIIPASVETIGRFAFTDCFKLQSVRFEENSNLIEIEPHAFGGAPFSRIALPVGTKALGTRAFNSSSFKNGQTYFYIPDTVNSIGSDCFSREVETVDFGGSASQWDSLTWNKNTGFDESYMTVNFNVPYPGQGASPSNPSIDLSTPLAPDNPAKGMTVSQVLAYLEMASAEVLKNGQPVPGDAIAATGMTLKAESGEEANLVVKGDVLGTGVVSIAQLVRLASALTGAHPLTGPFLVAGDLNQSGGIDISDLTAEAKLLARS